jgi:hypothetical protein
VRLCEEIKRTRTPNRTRAITSIGIPLIYSYLFFFFSLWNDGARVRGANELFRDLLLFFLFLILPPPPLDIRRRIEVVFLFFSFPKRIARSGCPGQRDIKHDVKATILNGGIMQTRS